MYLSYYDLKHKPFQISTDPGFLWLGEKHMEALSTLRYGVMDNKGFLLLTGDVGTGKTTLINTLLGSLGSDVLVACIRDPGLEPLDFFNYIASAFGMKGEIQSKGGFLVRFEQFLNDLYDRQKKALLIIDEAQRISQELLEEVRLLSNIERTESKLLNIFFVGQIEFNEILLRPVNRPIRQRITINYNIETLSRRETEKYIAHRIAIARRGAPPPLPEEAEAGDDTQVAQRLTPASRQEEQDIFSDKAVSEIYRFSSGYPRLINIICDRALLTGYVEEVRTVTAKLIRECARELEIPDFGPKRRPQESRVPGPRRRPVKTHEDEIDVPIADVDDALPPHRPPARNGANDLRGQEESSGRSAAVPLSISVGVLAALLLIALLNPGLPTRVAESVKASKVGQYAAASYKALASVWSSPEEKGATAGGRDRTVEPPPPPPAEQAAEQLPVVSGEPVAISLDKLILPFPEDAALPPLQSLANLNLVVASVLDEPSLKVVVSGFADTSSEEPQNRKTSRVKAEAIRIYLISRGLDASQIEVRGLGSQTPLSPGGTPAGRAANQRVEIELFR